VRALCLLLLIGGCNRVWGFDRPDAALDAVDAEIDAAVPTSITSVTISGEVATGESADITAVVNGTPHATVPYAFAGQGAFSLASGDMTFDDAGLATVMVRYTAPMMPKLDVIMFTAGDAVQMLTVDVLSLDTFGFDTALGTTVSVAKDTMHGVTIPGGGEGTFRTLGVVVSISSGAHHGRFALYAGDMTKPGMLLASTASQLLVNGRNAVPLSQPVHVQPTPATYWVVAVYDVATLVSTDTGLIVAPRFSKGLSFATAFPSTIAAPAPVDEKQHAYFVQFAQSSSQ